MLDKTNTSSAPEAAGSLDAKAMAERMSVLAVPARITILRILRQGDFCVNALSRRLGITPAAVSQHLRILRNAHLVVSEKRGYYVHYSLNEETFKHWKEQLLDFFV